MLINVDRIFKKMLVEYKLSNDATILSKILKIISAIIVMDKDMGCDLLDQLTLDIIKRDNNRFKAELNSSCYDDNDAKSELLIIDLSSGGNIFTMMKRDKRYRIFMSLDYSDELIIFFERCINEGYVSGILVDYCIDKILNDFKYIKSIRIDYINCGNDEMNFKVSDNYRLNKLVLCTPGAIENIERGN